MKKFLEQAVESGDEQRESTAPLSPTRVKLFAKSGGANKPRDATPYNLLQTLYSYKE